MSPRSIQSARVTPPQSTRWGGTQPFILGGSRRILAVNLRRRGHHIPPDTIDPLRRRRGDGHIHPPPVRRRVLRTCIGVVVEPVPRRDLRDRRIGRDALGTRAGTHLAHGHHDADYRPSVFRHALHDRDCSSPHRRQMVLRTGRYIRRHIGAQGYTVPRGTCAGDRATHGFTGVVGRIVDRSPRDVEAGHGGGGIDGCVEGTPSRGLSRRR
mmetsp:Transcript_39840/g.119852  ORF Transcript_39840/g.119852 Transcript_39840/m.119852 type:complete len:211 (+) Transcript_39840:1356-1988(+)